MQVAAPGSPAKPSHPSGGRLDWSSHVMELPKSSGFTLFWPSSAGGFLVSLSLLRCRAGQVDSRSAWACITPSHILRRDETPELAAHHLAHLVTPGPLTASPALLSRGPFISRFLQVVSPLRRRRLETGRVVLRPWPPSRRLQFLIPRLQPEESDTCRWDLRQRPDRY